MAIESSRGTLPCSSRFTMVSSSSSAFSKGMAAISATSSRGVSAFGVMPGLWGPHAPLARALRPRSRRWLGRRRSNPQQELLVGEADADKGEAEADEGQGTCDALEVREVDDEDLQHGDDDVAARDEAQELVVAQETDRENDDANEKQRDRV